MKWLLLSATLTIVLFSCDRSNGKHPCYDESFVYKGACPQDCPGVTGCDGKFYCNECIAAQHGVRIVKK